MAEKKDPTTLSPEWGGWVVFVKNTANADRWVNGIFDNEDEANQHRDDERKAGREAVAVSLWLLNPDHLRHLADRVDNHEGTRCSSCYDLMTLDAVNLVRSSFGFCPSCAESCWKCGAEVGLASLCPECLTQQ